MTRASEPGTLTSRAHSSGTWLRPIRRAATAGNSASRSSVSVKMQDTRSSVARPLRSSSVRMTASVAVRIASASLPSTLLAPRSAMSRMDDRESARALPQPLDLRRGQLPVPAGLELAEPQRPERDPLERDDRVPDGLEHPPDLPSATLVDGQLEVVR